MKLSVENVWAGYGGSQILREMTFDVNTGEIVAIFGRNGSGRSTALKAIAGVITPNLGSIRLDGRELVGLRPDSIAKAGVAYVPEDRQVFASLTVEENLRLGESRRKGFWSLERVWKLFPRLLERKSVNAGFLSGGEQQMLTICRTLMGDPDLIMVDEPTEGLAPRLVEQVRRLLDQIAARGVAILLIEQKLTIALAISHRLYVMGQGRIVFEGSARDLRDNHAVRSEWLEV